MISIHRQIFFDKQVHMKKWKDSMSGKNEKKILRSLDFLEFKEGIDFFRQYPIGGRFVLDFAFVKEQVALEIDGKTHNHWKQKEKDRKRDRFLLHNNWIPLRFRDEDLLGSKGTFFKYLLKYVVEERREQYEKGRLLVFDIPSYEDKDYE